LKIKQAIKSCYLNKLMEAHYMDNCRQPRAKTNSFMSIISFSKCNCSSNWKRFSDWTELFNFKEKINQTLKKMKMTKSINLKAIWWALSGIFPVMKTHKFLCISMNYLKRKGIFFKLVLWSRLLIWKATRKLHAILVCPVR